MLELLFTFAVFAAAAVTIRGTRPRTPTAGDRLALAADLPCPWCHAATAESDPACPSCRRAFGMAQTPPA